MVLDRFVYWQGEQPDYGEIGEVLADFLGEFAVSVDWKAQRWTAQLRGNCSNMFRTYGSGSDLPRERWIEVHVTPDGTVKPYMNVVTHMQDDATNALADHFAARCAKRFGGRLDEAVSWSTTFDAIRTTAATDKKSLEQSALKLAEEAGELCRAVNIAQDAHGTQYRVVIDVPCVTCDGTGVIPRYAPSATGHSSCCHVCATLRAQAQRSAVLDLVTEEAADVLICTFALLHKYGIQDTDLNPWVYKKMAKWKDVLAKGAIHHTVVETPKPRWPWMAAPKAGPGPIMQRNHPVRNRTPLGSVLLILDTCPKRSEMPNTCELVGWVDDHHCHVRCGDEHFIAAHHFEVQTVRMARRDEHGEE